jgi:hypothetical protein
MTTMRFSASERQLLRERALENWRRAQELARDAEAARQRSSETTKATAALVALSLSRPTVTHLVDRAISRWSDRVPGSRQLDQGVALVASGDMSELIRIEEILRGHFSYVVGASDVGTTLGLAIATQPEYVVLDERLELGNGVEAALTLPVYAPHTKALVLTDDPQRAEDVRIAGFDTESRHIAGSTLLSWVEGVAA